MRIRAFLATVAIGVMMTNAPGAFAAETENTLYLNLKDGRVVIQMLPEVAPRHVDRIKELVRANFYDGLTFHRVIAGFMAQTGDPKGDGAGGSGTKLPAEFSNTPFVRGTLGMARSQDPNSADSQFFIMFAPAPHLNGQYTVWGKVVDGMEYVDQIKKGNARSNDTVESPDRIISIELASEVNP
jgi:peptidylprolyl isomerase